MSLRYSRKMKTMVILTILFTLAASKPTCNEQEREVLKQFSRQQFGFRLMYAVDETLSSRNSLGTAFQHMNYHSRDHEIPFIFHDRNFMSKLTISKTTERFSLFTTTRRCSECSTAATCTICGRASTLLRTKNIHCCQPSNKC